MLTQTLKGKYPPLDFIEKEMRLRGDSGTCFQQNSNPILTDVKNSHDLISPNYLPVAPLSSIITLGTRASVY